MTMWKVKAMQLGTIKVDRSNMTHYKGKGEQIVIPVWSAAATDGKHKVVIDTGIRDVDDYRKAEPGVTQSEDEKIVNALKNIVGWDVEDVDIVINTHLHVDHTGDNRLFKNAKFYVQKKEWVEAHNPPRQVAQFYDYLSFDKHAVPYFKWNFLEGDSEILPGLHVITTPGHTMGHQSVLLDTKDGVVCVSGDVCNTADNINENLEPNLIIGVKEIYESMDRVRQFAHYVLPGHEPSIENGSEKFVEVADATEFYSWVGK